jgi:hypothetical protein
MGRNGACTRGTSSAEAWWSLTRVLCVLLRQECQHVYASADTGSHHVVFFPCLQFLQDRLTLYKAHTVQLSSSM